MTNPKRQITGIVRVDAATTQKLEVETAVLFAIYQRALTDWLDSLDRLKDAERNAQNATEVWRR
jgi:hypothetical protein